MRQKIWSYWHQGFEDAPYLIKKCVNQCKSLHTNWDIHFLDQNTIYNYADEIPIQKEKWEKIELPHQSDLLRTQLLIKHGGVWLDPTVYCVQPIDNWLPQHMKAGIFLFDRPGKDRIISNWFIAAEKENYVLKKLYYSLIEYWNTYDFRNFGQPNHKWAKLAHRWINGRSMELSQIWISPLFKKVLRIYPYMIYHYMFYHLIQTDGQFKKLHNNMPKLSADGPHLLQREGLLQPLSDTAKDAIDHKHSPLFKLTWKLQSDKVPNGSTLDYLFNN